MIIGSIRPVETRAISVQGASLEEVYAAVAAQTPEGWELVAAPVEMSKTDSDLRCTATIARREPPTTLEAEDLDDLRRRLPEGYEILSVSQV